MQLPYFTSKFPGIGGSLKDRPEDFFVQEIPAYEPSGEGEHVYAEIQKVGLTTFVAIDRIARALDVHPRNIGYAGLKDARAITRQTISLLGVTEDKVMSTKVEGVEFLWADRHLNKIRLGHLLGNRFAVKIRDVNPADVVRIQEPLEELKRRGMPNFFGEQRFGVRGNNHELGATLIRGRPEEFLHLLLGSPNEKFDEGDEFHARRLFDEGKFVEAMEHFPRRCGMERRTLARMLKTGQPGAAVRTIDEKLRRLWVSALQSHLFNQVLTKRIDGIDKIIPGDFAYKHENGACFPVTDPAAEQTRADNFEISATGPIVGYRMSMPDADALAIEQAVLKDNGLTPGHFKQEGRDQAKGTRRPLRVQPKDVEIASGVDDHGAHITVAFTLPAGSFATVLLGELMKNEEPAQDQTVAEEAAGDESSSGETASDEPASAGGSEVENE